VLRRAGVGAMALSGLGSAALTATGRALAASSNPAQAVASKTRPLTLPTYSDNKAIASGRSPEKGPLVIYDWADYLSNDVVKSFEERYGVKAEVTTFSSIDEAANKIVSGAIKPDVWVPNADRMLQLVEAKLIQPINHSYIPNLDNVIPAAADPWYDKGARYSSPDYINFYGVAWRNDLIKVNPASLKNPWDVYWTVPATTSMGMVNADPYTTICMELLRSGFTSLDTITQNDINEAVSQLQKLKGLKLQYTAFQPIATGVEKLAFAYNGDMMVVPQFLPKSTPLTDVSFYFPRNGYGIILNDMWVLLKNAANPVLGHLWMNHFLEVQSAISNFQDIGYQTMLKTLTVDKLLAAKVGPKESVNQAFATPEIQANGIPVPLPTTQMLEWFETAFTTLSTGT
jgi:spermidine/putrescine transport system substrate-binding protein